MSDDTRKPVCTSANAKGCCLLACVSMFGLTLLLTFWAVSGVLKSAPSYILHSVRPYREVVIPFEEDEDSIIVKASLAGADAECLIDTGCRDILWERLNVNCVWDSQWEMFPYMDGNQVPFKWATLPSLRLGDYELSNVRSAYLYLPDKPLTATSQRRPIHVMLGNYAFRNVVLTMDFQQRRLIIRSPEYDIARLPHRREDCLLDFRLVSPYDGCPSYIVAKGVVADIPADFEIDTGHYAKGIIISPEVRGQLRNVPRGLPADFWYNMGGSSITEVTKPLAWKIGNVQGIAPAFVMKPINDWQAVLGYNDLKNFRVTIDYPRHKMLLEPYH